MKEKIIILIIGLLIGTIISTGGFYIYTVNKPNSCSTQNGQTKSNASLDKNEKQDGRIKERPNVEKSKEGRHFDRFKADGKQDESKETETKNDSEV